MAIKVIQPTRADMAKCVARFSDLVPCNTGVVDMELLPECERTFLNVLGFSQPKEEGKHSPFGNTAPAAITHLRAGFGLAFIGHKPGRGVLMHTHDTVETFMVINGKWRLEWELDSGTEGVMLEALDFIAIPVGVQRRFECIEAGQGREEGLLLGVVGGDAPGAEISSQGIERLIEAGGLQRLIELGIVKADAVTP